MDVNGGALSAWAEDSKPLDTCTGTEEDEAPYGRQGRKADVASKSSNKGKADTDDVYDSRKNFFSSVVLKAKRAISKLSTEEHVLTTLTAEQNPSERKVKQTHEMQRCFDAIAQAKQKIVDCLTTCDEAQGHRQVPHEHFTEEDELPVEHIKCSACENGESEEDNDILLCDGEGCNRCYHVKCVPFREDLDIQALLDDEESGWLCPACDAKYDIFWHLAETRDMEYDKLLGMKSTTVHKGADVEECRNFDLRCRPGEVFSRGDTHCKGTSSSTFDKENVDKSTILHAELPSSDDEDSDFRDSDLDESEARQGKAGPSGREEGKVDDCDDSDCDANFGQNSSEDESEEGESCSEDYIDDDDDASLDLRENEGQEPDQAGPSVASIHAGEDKGEILSGKRRRTQVDYEVLNSYLFGGEQDEDQEDAEYAADAHQDDSDDEIRKRKTKRQKKKRSSKPE